MPSHKPIEPISSAKLDLLMCCMENSHQRCIHSIQSHCAQSGFVSCVPSGSHLLTGVRACRWRVCMQAYVCGRVEGVHAFCNPHKNAVRQHDNTAARHTAPPGVGSQAREIKVFTSTQMHLKYHHESPWNFCQHHSPGWSRRCGKAVQCYCKSAPGCYRNDHTKDAVTSRIATRRADRVDRAQGTKVTKVCLTQTC